MRRTPTGLARRIGASRFALVLGLLVVAVFATAEQTGAELKNEFKLIVNAVDTATALKTLGLGRPNAHSETVYYFDTSDKILQAHHVTLRARQSNGHSSDSTVKLRARAGTLELSEQENALAPEQDWTSEHEPSESRSLSSKHREERLLANVAAGSTAVLALFTPAQRNLVEARVPGFAWEALKPFGPVEAQVWKRKAKLAGFAEAVTAELWYLHQDGRTWEILEISAKASAETSNEAKTLASQFFAAAKAAGLGEPDGQTKTKLVMDFFSAGR